MAERTWWIERWLSVCLSVSLSLCVSLSPSIYRATFLAIYLSTCLFMYLSFDLFIHLTIKLSIFLSIQPFIHPLTKPSRFAHFWQGPQSFAPATRNDIWTSKNGPYMVCFVHFDLETCFAPQRRALFQHLNFQKWSENNVFCTFWLGNVLRATMACTFSTS